MRLFGPHSSSSLASSNIELFPNISLKLKSTQISQYVKKVNKYTLCKGNEILYKDPLKCVRIMVQYNQVDSAKMPFPTVKQDVVEPALRIMALINISY
jgi:hypothetical protein